MYAETLKKTLKKRDQVIETHIETRWLALADFYLDKAIWFRRNAKVASQSDANFNRALALLLQANDVFDAAINSRFERYRNPSLVALLCEKRHRANKSKSKGD